MTTATDIYYVTPDDQFDINNDCPIDLNVTLSILFHTFHLFKILRIHWKLHEISLIE